MVFSIAHIFLVAAFALGYLAIIFEFNLRVNKTAVALLMGVVCWLVNFVGGFNPLDQSIHMLSGKLGDISQILFFLLGAMTLVELIDSHNGFKVITNQLHTKSKRKMLWLIAFAAFFLSAVLDNLTTTILMISLLRKLVPYKKDRFTLLCMVVIAANSGGAWTPIGDVTTTMLWINGQLSTLKVISEIFLPSLISMLIPLLIYTMFYKGKFVVVDDAAADDVVAPGARIVFALGITALIFVPIFKWLSGMPPYMGMILALSLLWLVTDGIHNKHEQRVHLRVPHILTKIDVSSILFFLGILLSVDALESAGLLTEAAKWMDVHVKSQPLIATFIGLFSAIIDNVPLVAATMGMYDLQTYPMDSSLWLMIAYAAGTGGSILLIGSSSGVALMGLEKINFISYLRRASLPALAGFLVGMFVYLLMNSMI
jgi:NhaD family Na+/H+ antiporter